jgi:hypothetical protein
MSSGGADPISVTAKVSYRNSAAGYFLVVGIVDMGSKPAKVVVGIPTSSPDPCAYQPVLEPYCYVATSSSSGTEQLKFKIGGIFGGPKGVGNWNLNMTGILLTPNQTIIENSRSSVLFTIVVSQIILTVKVPANVAVTVDGVKQPPGPVQVSVTSGQHNISVPNAVQLDNTTRLRFDSWSDGYASLRRTEKINFNQNYEAVYVTQYHLTILDQAASATGQDWYDAGTIATFSVDDTEPMSGILGALGGNLRFQAWYENNAVFTNATIDSIIMDGPHTLTASWKADFTIPIIISAALVALVLVTFAIYRSTTAKARRTRSHRSGTRRHMSPRSFTGRNK